MNIGKMKSKKVPVIILCCLLFAVFAAVASANAFFARADAPAVDESANSEADGGIVQTYRPELSLVNAPTVVLDAVNKTVLDSVQSKERKPSNVILRFDGDCNVISESGEIIGKFADIYIQTVKPCNIIPILNVADEAAANAAIKFLSEEMDLLDIAVMSSDPALVKKVRTANGKIRGIVSYSEDADLSDLASVTNAAYANVAVIPQSLATAENVRYVHARFKTVWVSPASSGKFDLYDCVCSGAYGIVSADSDSVYDVLGEYDAQGGLVRTPFNAAHRGVLQSCNENSVSGTLEAIAVGATHVELDAYLTKDNVIVFSHDRELARTSDGTGDIESYTSYELKSFSLDLFTPEPIPTFADIVGALKGSDVVLILEIKSVKSNFVQTLRSQVEALDFWNQMVVISFEQSILADMKSVLPEIPTADLNPVYTDNFAEMLESYCRLNTGVDTQYIGADESFNENYLRDRGFVGWYWTFETLVRMIIADNSGYVGLTNNCPEEFAYYTEFISGKEEYGKSDVKAGDDVKLTVTDYAGETRDEVGKVFKCEDCGEYWRLVAVYGRYYTQSFKLYKNDKPASKKKKCGSSASAEVCAVGIALLCSAAAIAVGAKKKAPL